MAVMCAVLQIVFLLAWKLPGFLHKSCATGGSEDRCFSPDVKAVGRCFEAKKAGDGSALLDLALKVASTVDKPAQ